MLSVFSLFAGVRSADLVDFDDDLAGEGGGVAGAGMDCCANLNGDVGVAEVGVGGAADLVGDAGAAGEAGCVNNGSKSVEGMMRFHPSFSFPSNQTRELS